MPATNGSVRGTAKTPPAITSLSVSGFKSISREQTLHIRPLTLLAGANSSGKSSMMQPLLLLKQTLEAPYDPGPLLLNGPNVRFTSAKQFLSIDKQGSSSNKFKVSIEIAHHTSFSAGFRWIPNHHKLVIQSNTHRRGLTQFVFSDDTAYQQIAALLNGNVMLEAALATDKRVISLDEQVRKHLKAQCVAWAEVRSIDWVNPAKTDERAIDWLKSGAPIEPARTLGNTPRGRKN